MKKNLWRRTLSMFLAMVLALGLLPQELSLRTTAAAAVPSGYTKAWDKSITNSEGNGTIILTAYKPNNISYPPLDVGTLYSGLYVVISASKSYTWGYQPKGTIKIGGQQKKNDDILCDGGSYGSSFSAEGLLYPGDVVSLWIDHEGPTLIKNENIQKCPTEYWGLSVEGPSEAVKIGQTLNFTIKCNSTTKAKVYVKKPGDGGFAWPVEVQLTANQPLTYKVADKAALGQYEVYALIEETDFYTSNQSRTASVQVGKYDQNAPAAPTVCSVTADSVTLQAITAPGQGSIEYGYVEGTSGGTPNNWQSGTQFTSLKAATGYTFYARYAGNDTYNPSPASSTTAYTAYSAPGTNEGYTINYYEETVQAQSGYEIKIGQGNWTDSSTAQTVTPGVAFQVRQAALSGGPPASAPVAVTPPGRDQAPGAPTVTGRTDRTITVAAASGQEYRLGESGTWQKATGSIDFTGLNAGQSYNVYTRVAATDSAFASEASSTSAATKNQPTMKLESNATDKTTVGDAVTFTATLTGNGKDAVEGTVTFKNGNDTLGQAVVANGTATLTMDGNNTLPAGTYNVTATFEAAADCEYVSITTPVSCTEFIVKIDIQGATITLGTVDPYNGQQKTVSITKVVLGGVELQAGTDYTIQQGSNVGADAGTHTLAITGTGNYIGTASQTWEIEKATLGADNVGTFFATHDPSKTYDGAAFSGTAYSVKASFSKELGSGTLAVYYKAGSGDWTQEAPAAGGTYAIGVTIPTETANFKAITTPVGVGTLTIQKATPTVTITASPSTSTYEAEVTFTVAVEKAAGAGATIPRGAVSLTGADGAAFPNPVDLDQEGKATFTTDAMTAKSHTLSAAYTAAGDEGNYGDASGSQSYTVGKKSLTINVSGQDQVYTGSAKGVTIDSANSKLQAGDFRIQYYEVYENGGTLLRTNAVTPIGQGKYLYVIDFNNTATGDNYALASYTVPNDTTTPLPDPAQSRGRAGYMTITSGLSGQQMPIYFASSQVTKYVTDSGYEAAENALTNGNNGSTTTYSSSNTAVATVDGNSGAVTILGAGTATIQAVSTKEGTTPVYASYTLQVVKKPITVAAQDKSITYGAAHGYGAGDVTVSDGAALDDLAGDLTFSTRYQVGANVGSYTVAPGGLHSDKYAITFVPGTLTVEEKTLTAADFTVSAADKTYDGGIDAVVKATVKADSLVGGDSLRATAEGTFCSAGAGQGKEVDYTITDITGAKAGNYKAENVTGTTQATIRKAAVQILCPADTTRTYTGQAQGVTLSAMTGAGPFEASRYTVHYTPQAGGTSTDAPVDVGVYTVSVELNDEADKQNYEVAPFQATLTIESASQDIFYLAGVPAVVYYGDVFTLAATGAKGAVRWSAEGPATIDGSGQVAVTGTGAITITATSTLTGHEDRTATVTFTAGQRVLAAAAVAEGKTYDGSTAVHIASYTLTDAQTGNSVTNIEVTTAETAYTADANAGRGKLVYIGGLYLTGDGAANYTLQATSITTTVDVAKREISAFQFTAAGKVYDGSTAAQVTSITLADLAAGDEGDVTLLGSAAFADAGAAAGKTVTYTATGLTGPKAGNYTLQTTAATTQASIAAMPLSFTVGAASFAYDGTAKTVAVTAVDQKGALFTNFEVLYADSTEAPRGAGTYAVTVQLPGDLAGNYDISSFPTTTLTITQAGQDQLTIVGLPGTAEYGTSFTLQALGGSGSGEVTWKSDSDEVTVADDGNGSATVSIGGAVGSTVTITATKASDDNHTEKNAVVVLRPVAQAVQFTLSGTTQTYDGDAKSVTVEPSVKGAAYTVTYNGSSTPPTEAGAYTVEVQGTGHYTGAAYGLLTVKKAAFGGLGVTLAGWTYGDEGAHTPSCTGTLPDRVSVAYSYSTADGQQPVNAGNYTLYGTFTGDNYETLTVSQPFTIDKATLVATAEDVTRDYGTANPIFQVKIEGFKNSEDASALWQHPVATTTADAASAVGTYDITVSGGSAQNYDFRYEPGTLTVRPASGGGFYIDGVNNAQVGDVFTLRAFYGTTQPAVTWSSSDAAVAAVDAASGQVTAHKAGDVAITATLTDGNYTAAPATFTLHITKRSVNLQVSGTVLAYNGRTQGITLTSGDSAIDAALEGAIKVDYTLTTDPAVTTPRNVGIYSVNYHIDHGSYDGSGSTTLYINKADVVLKPADLAKVYGDANPAYAVAGLLGEDAADAAYLAKVGGLFTFASDADAAGAKAPAGEYDITLALKAGYSLTEDANYNFTISQAPGKLTVNTRPITVTAKDQTIAYSKGLAQGVEQVTAGGLNEGARLTAVTLTASTTAVGSGTATPSAARVSWDGVDVTGNYAVTYIDGSLTITKLAVAASAGTGQPDRLTIHFSEALLGLQEGNFAVTPAPGGGGIAAATPSAGGKTYTLYGTFESGRTYTVTVTVDDTLYTLTGSPVEIAVYAGGGGGGGGGAMGGGGPAARTYAITLKGGENGAVRSDRKTAQAGETVTLTVTADEGYVLDTLTVQDAGGNAVPVAGQGDSYTFTMPASDVEVAAAFRQSTRPSGGFIDVPGDAYYADAVEWAVAQGITQGTGDGRFSPASPVSRGQMVTFLWRAAGAPAATGPNPFADVSSDAYYREAVLWAVEKGITQGTSATTFSPDAPVTRAQAVTFQWRAAGAPAAAGGNLQDVAADAYYADAVAWAVAQGITQGTSATTFSPDEPVTRAQAVTFLYRGRQL